MESASCAGHCRPGRTSRALAFGFRESVVVDRLRRRTGLIPVLRMRSGIAPDLEETALRSVPTPIACQLTELSTDKLREWTRRRALVPADVRPKGKGSPAGFSWQTILVLRIAVLLRDRFNLELQAHKHSLDNLRKALRTKSFIVLWGQRLALHSNGDWSFLEQAEAAPGTDTLLIHLDPHLRVLRDGFTLPDAEAQNGQLDLFSLPAVRGRPARNAAADVRPRRHRAA